MTITIFLVEDEIILARSLSRKLKQLGYQVIGTATSGEDAIEKIIEHPPDVVLMDIVIQGEIDGIQTTQKLLKSIDIPVIYLTAYADDETLDRAEASGSYGYLLKPPKEREIHATLKMVLKKHKDARLLKQLIEKSKDSLEKKSQYLSMTSHDLRNPLTAIQMSSDMLKTFDESWDRQRKLKYFERIQRAITSINGMLDEVSLVSKAESGKLPFLPQPLDLVAFIQEIIAEFEPLSENKHQLQFQYEPIPETPVLDKILLRHILANLLINAIKYSPEGGVITLTLQPIPKGIEVQVADHGLGIPEADLCHLFDRHQRASNVSRIPGTGLGLYISQKAVECHGGSISVESQVGEGTTFSVKLPSCTCLDSSPLLQES
ncbi:ATP-binding protein [Phormidium yuhuli AB48]|uniref:histidine kinase n=1 Tax=Phormidium yuhuli AB48 TaxID=2940671 RepID=A0ABY5AP80_9CYAN|nr:ATP-binding protein [Phormidium yuhuli]USR91017.1 ATP-binding protein [Phormidium yuhuli AB48]